jgi:hypothetical protein
LLTYGIDTISGYLTLFIIRSIILWLDKRVGYFQNIFYRLVLQILLTTAGTMLFTIVSTEGVNFFFNDKPVPFVFYWLVLPIIFIWVLVINGVYVGLYFYYHLLGYQLKIKELEQASIELSSPKSAPSTSITATVGKHQVWLEGKDIVCFYVEDELTLALTYEGKKYIVNQSLEKLEASLDSTLFYRANRQVIVQRHAISQISKEENGKLTLALKPVKDAPSPINISRTKAPDFKKWVA